MKWFSLFILYIAFSSRVMGADAFTPTPYYGGVDEVSYFTDVGSGTGDFVSDCSKTQNPSVALSFLDPRNVVVNFDEEKQELSIDILGTNKCQMPRVAVYGVPGKDTVFIEVRDDQFIKPGFINVEDSEEETLELSEEEERKQKLANVLDSPEVKYLITLMEDKYKDLQQFEKSASRSEKKKSSYKEAVEAKKKSISEMRAKITSKLPSGINSDGELNPLEQVTYWQKVAAAAPKKIESGKEDSKTKKVTAFEECMYKNGYIDSKGNRLDEEIEPVQRPTYRKSVKDLVSEGKPFKVLFASNKGFPGYKRTKVDQDARFPSGKTCYSAEEIGGKENTFLVRTKDQKEAQDKIFQICMASSTKKLEEVKKGIEPKLLEFSGVMDALRRQEASITETSTKALLESYEDHYDDLNSYITRINALDKKLSDLECDPAEESRMRCIKNASNIGRDIASELADFARLSFKEQKSLMARITELQDKIEDRNISDDVRFALEKQRDDLEEKFQALVDLQEPFIQTDSDYEFWENMELYGLSSTYASTMRSSILLEEVAQRVSDQEIVDEDDFDEASKIASEWYEAYRTEGTDINVKRQELVMIYDVWKKGSSSQKRQRAIEAYRTATSSYERCKKTLNSPSCNRVKDRATPYQIMLSKSSRILRAGGTRQGAGRLYRSSGYSTRGVEDYGFDTGSLYQQRGGRGYQQYNPQDPMRQVASRSLIPSTRGSTPGMPQGYEENLYCQEYGMDYDSQTNMCTQPKKKYFTGYTYANGRFNMGMNGNLNGMAQGSIFAQPNYYGGYPYGANQQYINYGYPQMAQPINPYGNSYGNPYGRTPAYYPSYY